MELGLHAAVCARSCDRRRAATAATCFVDCPRGTHVGDDLEGVGKVRSLVGVCGDDEDPWLNLELLLRCLLLSVLVWNAHVALAESQRGCVPRYTGNDHAPEVDFAVVPGLDLCKPHARDILGNTFDPRPVLFDDGRVLFRKRRSRDLPGLACVGVL